jgi:CheY-like chemotaxis protein
MHGADVARLIRKSHPELPVVFVTGYAESQQMDMAGGDNSAVLRKPFTMADLCRILEEKLPRR